MVIQCFFFLSSSVETHGIRGTARSATMTTQEQLQMIKLDQTSLPIAQIERIWHLL